MRFFWIFIFSASFLIPIVAQDEPVRGFVTLEPFEIRVEALCEPIAFREEWGLSSDYIEGIVKDRTLAQSLEALKNGVSIKSRSAEFRFDSTQTRFVTFNKDLGYVPDEREKIPLHEAIIGISISSVSENINDLDIAWLWRAPTR